jgi:predicted transcriptional regulator
MNEQTRRIAQDARQTIIAILRGRAKKARFITELAAALARSHIGVEQMEQALSELQDEGVVMMRDHFCADPHLEGVDLRIVTLAESADGADPQISAIREIDNAWDKWLADYLSNHRCG